MNKKIIGVINGLAIIILWFMPFRNINIDFMGGMNMYQSGEHIGGITYLLLVSGAAIAVLSWKEQYQLCLIAAGAGLLISLLELVTIGESVAWGLLGLIGCLISASVTAYREMRGMGKAAVDTES